MSKNEAEGRVRVFAKDAHEISREKKMEFYGVRFELN